jgi:hypothetical protein
MIETKFPKNTIGERKDEENRIALLETINAILYYIAACDYPEIIEGEGAEVENE